MDIQTVRRAVLRSLIKRNHGNIARQFALAVGKPDGQINDMLADPPRKSFGERIARSLESNYKPAPLPSGFFDDPKNADESIELPKAPQLNEPKNVVYGQFNGAISEVIRLMNDLDDEAQREIVGAVRMLHTQAKLNRQNSTRRAGQ